MEIFLELSERRKKNAIDNLVCRIYRFTFAHATIIHRVLCSEFFVCIHSKLSDRRHGKWQNRWRFQGEIELSILYLVIAWAIQCYPLPSTDVPIGNWECTPSARFSSMSISLLSLATANEMISIKSKCTMPAISLNDSIWIASPIDSAHFHSSTHSINQMLNGQKISIN